MTVRAHCQVTTFDATSNSVMTAATVNVYTPGTVTPISATIYDRLGNPLSNPLTSDATTGLCDFYLLVAQEVDLVVSKSAFTTRTYSNVPVLDDSSLELTALLTTTGDTIYASSANTPVRLPIGTNNYVMNVTAGVPKWTSALLVSDANGNAAVGGAILSNSGLTVASTALSTTTQAGLNSQPTFSSSATAGSYGVYSSPSTAAASFTATGVSAFFANTPTLGAASAITTSYGLQVANQGASGVTNAYGVYIAAQSGAATINIGLLCNSGALFLGTPPSLANALGLGYATSTTGGGATATMGTIGGTGPTTAGQNAWWKLTINNTTVWVPFWT